MQPVATAEDAAFLAGLLEEVDTNTSSRRVAPPIKTIKTESRRKIRVLSPPLSENRKVTLPKARGITDPAHLLSTPPTESAYDDDDDGFFRGMDDDAPMSDPMPSSPVTNAVTRKGQAQVKAEEEVDDDLMEIAQAVGHNNVKTTSVNISGSRPVPKTAKKPSYPSPQSSSPTRTPVDDVGASVWNDVTSKLNVLSSSPTQTATFGKLDVQDALEEDGSLRMFWTDYTEVNGSLCLFGKVKDKKTGAYVSAFVKIDNILRKLFFLPRTYKRSTSLPVQLAGFT